MHFNIWVNDNGKQRWTNAVDAMQNRNPQPLSYKVAKELIDGPGWWDLHPRVRVLLPDGSPGEFCDSDPSCPQCGNIH